MTELTTKQNALIHHMRKSEQHAAHGFELILKSKEPRHFFAGLRAAGLFDAGNSPAPREVEGKPDTFRIPYWPALKYLVHLAGVADAEGDRALGSALMEIIRALGASDGSDDAFANYHTAAACAEILATVPRACVTPADIDLAPGWLANRWDTSLVVPELDKAMRRFLEGNAADIDKAVRLLRHCLALQSGHRDENSTLEVRSRADAYWLEQLLEHNAHPLGQRAGATAMTVLLDGVRGLFAQSGVAESSWLHRPAIEDHEQNHKWDHVVNAFIDASRDALDAWFEADAPGANVCVAQMLQDPAQIVRRLGIHTARMHWDQLDDATRALLPTLLGDIGHVHELKALLREHYHAFSPSLKAALHEGIAGLPCDAANGGDRIGLLQRRQRMWLHAMQGQGDAVADAAYREVVAAVGEPGEHPDFLSYHQSWWGSGPSPYNAEELGIFADDRTLIRQVDDYVPPRDERRGSRKSLIDALSTAIVADPDRYSWMLTTDQPMSRRIHYALVSAFQTLVEQGAATQQPGSIQRQLDDYLPFILRLIEDPAFWAEAVEESDSWEPNKDWIPPAIANAAKKLAANDAIALSSHQTASLLAAVKALLRHADGMEMSNDPMTAAINTARGTAIEGLLQILLRRCRAEDAQHSSHAEVWHEMRPLVEEELAGCVNGRRLETSTLFSCYLPQLRYVASDWTDVHVDALFPFEHPDNLQCALSGLAFASSSHAMYSMLKAHDVPCRALLLPMLDGSARERLIERVAIAFLWNLEQLDSPVIGGLFAAERVEDLHEFCSTAVRWSRPKLRDDQVTRLVELARRVVAFGLEDPVERALLLATASGFIKFADTASGNIDWLEPVAVYAQRANHEYDFLQELAKLANAEPEHAQQIVRAFLETYQVNYDYRDRLKNVLRILHAAGWRQNAQAMVDMIVKKGGGPEWTALYNEFVDAPRLDSDALPDVPPETPSLPA